MRGLFCFKKKKKRVVDLAREAVCKHRIMFVASAGNNGPAVTTSGAPGGTTPEILSVGAYACVYDEAFSVFCFVHACVCVCFTTVFVFANRRQLSMYRYCYSVRRIFPCLYHRINFGFFFFAFCVRVFFFLHRTNILVCKGSGCSEMFKKEGITIYGVFREGYGGVVRFLIRVWETGGGGFCFFLCRWYVFCRSRMCYTWPFICLVSHYFCYFVFLCPCVRRSPSLMSASFSMRETLEGRNFTWTSAGPTADGDVGERVQLWVDVYI